MVYRLHIQHYILLQCDVNTLNDMVTRFHSFEQILSLLGWSNRIISLFSTEFLGRSRNTEASKGPLEISLRFRICLHLLVDSSYRRRSI